MIGVGEGSYMAKPIKKNKSRFSTRINFNKSGNLFGSILVGIILILGFYLLYQHSPAVHSNVNHSIATLKGSIQKNGLLPTVIVVLVPIGLLLSIIFKKK